MIDIPISLPAKSTDEKITNAIDSSIAEVNLTVTMRDTLKKFPGCVHWHVKTVNGKNSNGKNGLEPGTLEITFWPAEHRAWFTVQDGRKAEWIEAKLKLFQKNLRVLL